MNLATEMGRLSGRAMPSLQDDPFRQNNETGRHSTYLLPIAVQTNRATSLVWVGLPDERSQILIMLLDSACKFANFFTKSARTLRFRVLQMSIFQNPIRMLRAFSRATRLQPCAGTTSSTITACSGPSRPPRPRRTTIQPKRPSIWYHEANETASGKRGTLKLFIKMSSWMKRRRAWEQLLSTWSRSLYSQNFKIQ